MAILPNQKKITSEELDNRELQFGKYKGRSPVEIAEFDPGYIVWAHGAIKNFCSQTLLIQCQMDDDYHDEFDHDFDDVPLNRF